MSLKTTLIFSILFITPLTAFGLTDDEVMAKYANPLELQNAIDKGNVDYNSLSLTMQKVTHPLQMNTNHNPFDVLSYTWIIAPIGAVVIFLGRLLFGTKKHNTHHNLEQEPKTVNLKHSPFAKVLLILGIIKVRKS